MLEWTTQQHNFLLINNLGFAMLQRMSSDESVFPTVNTAYSQWEVDGICSVWNLLCESLLSLCFLLPSSIHALTHSLTHSLARSLTH